MRLSKRLIYEGTLLKLVIRYSTNELDISMAGNTHTIYSNFLHDTTYTDVWRPLVLPPSNHL